MSVWCRGPRGTRGSPLACTLLSAAALLLTSLIPLLALADVVTDGTLGDGSSPIGPHFEIPEAMGERPGGGVNLFHSFDEFSLSEAQSATFGGDDAVENILGRVTGGSRSEIFGAIRTAPSLGVVDLYLMNPSGMVFGESAELDINGSFHATTADYIGLGGGGERFYADPSRTSLLSAAPPSAFGFLGGGAADDGLAAITVENATLEVREGESLSLIARDAGSGGVELSGATLRAPGGRIDLVSVGSPGEVRLSAAENPGPELTGFEALGAIDILSKSSVDASGDPPGSVWIRGGRLVVGDSEVLAVNQGADPSGGRISIAADESVLVWQEALIDAGTEASGTGGEIDVTAPELTIDDAKITTSTAIASEGDAGDIHLDVGTLAIRNGDGPALDFYQAMTPPRGVSAETRGSGRGGTLKIDADSVELTAAAAISVSTIGPDAKKAPDAAPEDPGPDAGKVEIHAHSLLLRNGGYIMADTDWGSDGNGGEVILNAETITLDSVTTDTQRFPAFVEAGTFQGSTGDAGNIAIDAGSLNLVNGSFMNAATGTTGNGGTISIRAQSVLLEGIHHRVKGDQDAGAIIHAQTTGIGDAGTIDIRAGSLDIRTDAQIDVSSYGSGDAGTIKVNATDSVSISHAGGDRFSLLGFFGGDWVPAGIYSATIEGGDGGSITVSAPEITVTDGAVVGTPTLGGGDAGDVTLRGERITISGGAFVDSTSLPVPAELSMNSVDLPGGAAGSVTLEATESIAVEGRGAFGDQSRVASLTLGSSDAGSVSLRAPLILVDDGAIATTSVASPLGESGGRGGEIVLEAEELHVIGGGQVDSSSMTAGEAGSIRVLASESLQVAGAGSGISSRTGGPGPGGDVEVRAPQIEVSDGGEVSAESSAGLQETSDIFGSVYDEGLIEDPPAIATGNAGSVTLEADQVLVQSGSIATHSEAADGGDVTILATEMLHLIDGEITASVSSGSGGNIVIDPVFVILEGESRIVAQAIEGSGGNISITTDALLASQESVISASSQLGVQGTVEIHSPETDVAGTLASLPETFLEAAALMKERCAARKGGESAGSFVWTGRQGVSWSPDGMIPASYREAEERPEPDPLAGLVLGTSPETGERVAFLVGCGGGASRR